MKNAIYFSIFVLAFLASCKMPPLHPSHMVYQEIKTGPGPEDMVLDTNFASPRLLIGCNFRRPKERRKLKRSAEMRSEIGIYQYVIGDKGYSSKILPRYRDSAYSFNPLGMSIATVNDTLCLYVINKYSKEKGDAVFRYMLTQDSLILLKAYFDEKIQSLNAMYVQSDGSFYGSNDFQKGPWKYLKKTPVVYCNAEGKCQYVTSKLKFPNGIGIRSDSFYLATTRQNQLLQFKVEKDGTLSNKKIIWNKKGQDNLKFYGRKLVIPVQLSPIRFLGHRLNSKYKSPTVVYLLDPEKNLLSNPPKPIYQNNGEQINTGSTGIIFNGKLYISQVYDPFIIAIDYLE